VLRLDRWVADKATAEIIHRLDRADMALPA
jgi:hypothetical protein